MQSGPAYPQQPAPPAKKSSAWIIILIVVVIGGIFVVPVVAALGIYGVRRYLASAKTSEAKITVGAIARGAKASYEREQMGGGVPARALCRSAISVPTVVPSGKKYMPSSAPGADFDTGDAETGWKCLKFAMTQSIYYKYSYTKGAIPVVAATGATLPAPGPESFEAAAEGDLDGDSVTSAFALVGQADSAGELRLATQIFVSDEFE